MNTTKFTVGLIGAVADISDAHLDAIHSNPAFQLRSVCDINEEKLNEKYNSTENIYLTTDYKTLLADNEIDTIVICTPNHLHAPIAIEALKANKHVLCEKPMTISPKQSNDILKAMEDSSGVFVVSYHFEFFPEVQYLNQNLHQFSDIQRFRFESSEHLPLTQDKAWNYIPYKGGVWLDWAPNALSVLKKVIAQNSQFNNFKILDAKLNSSLGLEIETNVNVRLLLNSIEGDLKIDWEANEGDFIARTTFWDSNNTEILLDHADNCIYVDKKKIWCGQDLRYRVVYDDFAQRIQSKTSNIEVGIFTSQLISEVFKSSR